MNDLHVRIRAARERLGWSQTRLAVAADGMHSSIVSKIEGGKTGSSMHMAAILRVLGLPPEAEYGTVVSADDGPLPAEARLPPDGSSDTPLGRRRAALMRTRVAPVAQDQADLDLGRLRALAASGGRDSEGTDLRHRAEREWRDETGLCRSWHHDMFVVLAMKGWISESDLRNAIDVYWDRIVHNDVLSSELPAEVRDDMPDRA